MKIENVEVYGLKNAIKISKYPMSIDTTKVTSEVTKMTKTLAQAKQGSGHDNFLKGIVVEFDLTMPIKMSVELERYHYIDFISSQSTIHRVSKLDLKQQCNEYVDERIIDIVQEMIDVYNGLLEENKNSDFGKDLYLRILFNIPTGYELTAGMVTNYLQLKTIYYQRKNHKLPCWREFCKWIETLPMFKELVLGIGDETNAIS